MRHRARQWTRPGNRGKVRGCVSAIITSWHVMSWHVISLITRHLWQVGRTGTEDAAFLTITINVTITITITITVTNVITTNIITNHSNTTATLTAVFRPESSINLYIGYPFYSQAVVTGRPTESVALTIESIFAMCGLLALEPPLWYRLDGSITRYSR